MTRLKPTVLAIEDDPDFLKALELVLGRFGLNIKGVSEIGEFLDLAKKVQPDLFLIDLQLGEASGLDLIERLRKNLEVKKPIVVISGAQQAASVVHAIEIGANDYIIKPLDRKFLASKLSRFFKTEEMEQHSSSFRDLPQGRVQARLLLDGVITEIDELGVRILSKNLLPKGLAFKLSSDFFLQMGLKSGECLLTVISTTLDSESQYYSIYAEFDGVDVEFLQSVRRWLSQGTNH